ncbi:Prophage antirepressor [Azotobacter beijerinckii]|uniref:Prophage antirepressor n=1 Tax=Azotobacter beijerinckii TaxID=170623 RepID=A0A1H9SP63_9GAMM|nr:BRO family protein [Azotobacter beijerinckii]SER86183.1 Prophage antirepressor [Azotobacter beijerinckii]
MQALVFRDTQFDITDRNGQPWVRANQIGLALGYKNPELSIAKLYRSNADEFTEQMTALIDLPTNGGIQQVRIFSLRGAHLLAMFARTEVAKEFRRWVLDVLDGLSTPESAPVGPVPVEPIHLTYNDRPFRIVPEGAALWFVAVDVARALDMRDAHGLTRHLRSEHKAQRQVGHRRLGLIDRAGLELALHHASPARSEPLRLWLEAALEQFVTGEAPAHALPGGLSGEQQGALRALVRARTVALPSGRRKAATLRCWSALRSEFGCGYREIDPARFDEALGLVAGCVLEGELLEREAPKGVGRLDIDYPIEDWKARNPHQFRHDNPNTPELSVTTGDLLMSEYSPGEALLGQLAEAGYRVDGPLYELRALRSLARRLDMTMRFMAGHVRQALDNFEHDHRRVERFAGAKTPL